MSSNPSPLLKTENAGGTQRALLRLLLRNKAGLTIDRIGESLAITRTAVAQHLNALLRDGLVERTAAVATGGRPGAVFTLSDQGTHVFPKKYDLVSLKAFEALIDAVGATKARKVLERLGKGLGEELGRKLAGSKLRDKMPAIAAAMEELGFDAHVETAAPNAAPEIKAYNCIYHSLAKARPEVCALDLAFLKEAAGAEVEHVCCMAKGANECRFRFAAGRNRRR